MFVIWCQSIPGDGKSLLLMFIQYQWKEEMKICDESSGRHDIIHLFFSLSCQTFQVTWNIFLFLFCHLLQEKDLKQYMDDCNNILSMNNIKVGVLLPGQDYHDKCFHRFVFIFIFPLFVTVVSLSTTSWTFLLSQTKSPSSRSQTSEPTDQRNRGVKVGWLWFGQSEICSNQDIL